MNAMEKMMNNQTKSGLAQVTQQQAFDAVKKRLPEDAEHLHPDYFDYWAWPQVFGSTTGPFGGIGGQACTTFTIEAWVVGQTAVLFCGERILKVTDKWEGPGSIRL